MIKDGIHSETALSQTFFLQYANKHFIWLYKEGYKYDALKYLSSVVVDFYNENGGLVRTFITTRNISLISNSFST